MYSICNCYIKINIKRAIFNYNYNKSEKLYSSVYNGYNYMLYIYIYVNLFYYFLNQMCNNNNNIFTRKLFKK